MHGKNIAYVQVSLSNDCADAYEPEKYGKKIVIEKKLIRDGSGGYKVMNERGEEVGRSFKNDILPILQHYNIQPENPCVVLTQDHCRTFIQSSSDKSLYHFFLKAAQLEDILERLISSHADIENMNQQMGLAVGVLENKERAKKEAFQSLQQAQELEELEEKRKETLRQLVWVQINRQEKLLVAAHEEEKEAISAREELLKQVSLCEIELEEKKKMSQEIQAQVDEVGKQIADYHQQVEAVRQRANDQKKKERDAKTKVEETKRILETTERRVKQAKKDIEEAQAKLGKDQQRNRQQREKQIVDLKEEIKNEQDRAKNIDDEIKSIMDQQLEKEQQILQLRQLLKSIEQQKRANYEERQQLLQSQQDRMFRYNKFAGEVWKGIRSSRFQVEPVGPIGAKITFNDRLIDINSWSTALYIVLGRSMANWLVDNRFDQELLRKIQLNVGDNRDTWVTQRVSEVHPRAYEVALSNERNAANGAKSVLTIMHSDSPWALQALVDQRSIENILLIGSGRQNRTDVEIAKTITQQNQHITIMMKDGYSVQSRNGSSKLTNPDLPGNNNYSSFFTNDVKNEIKRLENENQNIENKYQNISQELEPLQQNQIILQNKKKQLELQQSIVRKKLRDLQNEITQLKEKNEEDAVEISLLDQELEEANVQKEKALNLVKTAENELENLVSNREIIQLEMNSVHEDNNSRVKNHIEAKKKAEQIAKEIQIETQKKRKLADETKEAINLIEKKRQKIENCENELKEEKMIAEKLEKDLGPLIESTLSRQALEQRLKHFTDAIAQSEKKHDNRSFLQIKINYQRAESEYKDFKKQFDNVQKNHSTLKRMMDERRDRWVQMRDQQTSVTKTQFKRMLSKRGFTGNLDIDHTQQKLHMNVSVSSADKGDSSTKVLSGGERSYSTLCFLSALWHAMDCPFRILDEFDVFMDPVVRHVALDQLIKFCLKDTCRQFIFITPLDLSKIPTDNPDISVIMLKPPHRPVE
eukprot:c21997_g7_i1.p1 GENE.c21997_g7_i1~~c21997_g7_i1.p1  ORF type:complete len:1092 (-),score=479.25 c21997_g7_i1:93-3050(-)